MSRVDRVPEGQQQKPDEGRCDTNLGVCAQEIDPGQWKSFADDFSREQAGRTVSVEIRGETEGGAHWVTHETPLLGLVVGDEQKDSIEILLGGPAAGPLSHIVREATRLWQQQDVAGREVLQISSRDGTATILTVLATE